MLSAQEEAWLAVLRENYFSGVLEVEFEGRKTRFQSMRDMRVAIQELERRRQKPPRAGFASFSRGNG